MELNVISKYDACPFVGYSQATQVQKINAIKAVRALSRIGLKEAKDFVEDVIAKGKPHKATLTVVQSLTADEIKVHIKELRTAGLDVIEVGAEETESFRTQTRKMIALALEANNMALARDLFDLYEKHFA